MITNTTISVGKRRRLARLGDENGRLKMLAIDQRGSLSKMIARSRGIRVEDVGGSEMRLVKRVIIEAISPFATAVLTDPIYGYDSSLDVIPPEIGVLLALEVTGYEAGNEGERLSTLIEGWSVDKVLRSGADAAKLLLWHAPDASEETHRHQQAIVQEVGEACARADVPFVLEVVTYAVDGTSKASAEFARRKPEYVVDAARVYTDARFQVDLMKLEFPADLKYVAEYEDSHFASGEVVYDLDEVREICRRVDEASLVPWVILSAGVEAEEFVENIRLTCEAGASGFLCGRAVWKEIVDVSPDEASMRQMMQSEGRARFTRFDAAAADARPLFDHPYLRNEVSEAEGPGDDMWYRTYDPLS